MCADRPALHSNPIFRVSVKRLCVVDRLKSARSDYLGVNKVPFFLTRLAYWLLLHLRNIAEILNYTILCKSQTAQ